MTHDDVNITSQLAKNI